MNNIAVALLSLVMLAGCTKEYTKQLWSGQWDMKTESERHMCDINTLGYGCPHQKE